MADDVGIPSSRQNANNTHVPYRATKLWNEVLRLFRSELPVGRHRRQFRSYDGCFIASEAVSWLLQKLQANSNFGPQVTRGQTVQLLQKFHKAGLFVDVRGTKHDHDDFSDGSKLYRFAQSTPTKKSALLSARTPSRTPLATRTSMMNSEGTQSHHRPPIKSNSISHLPQEDSSQYPAPKTAELPRKHKRMLPQRSQSCRREREGATELLSEVQITADEIESMWRCSLLDNLKKILQLRSIGEVMDTDCVNIKDVIHNMTQVNKNGLVTNIDKREQLPHWIISAMRCLAYWPDRVEDNLPDYPGFEKDVYKVIKDYFWEMDEPLVPFQLYEVFLTVMVYTDNIRKPTKLANRQSTSSAHTLPSSTSVENLIFDMTNQDVNIGPDDILIFNDPDVTILPGGPYSSAKHRLPMSVSGTSLPGARLETSFGVNSNEPFTRLYQHNQENDESPGSGHLWDDCVSGRQHSRLNSRPYSICAMSDNHSREPLVDDEYMNKCNSLNNMHEIPENILALRGRTNSWMSLQSGAVLEDYPHREHLFTNPHHEINHYYRNRKPSTFYAPPPYSHHPPPYIPPPSYGSIHSKPPIHPLGISRRNDFIIDTGPAIRPRPLVVYQSPESDAQSLFELSQSLPALPRSRSGCNLAESYHQAISCAGPGATPVGRSLFGGRQHLRRSTSSPSVLTPLSRTGVYEVLQLCSLLLPPRNRRKLHLLLRFMNKVGNNSRLQVETGTSMKELVLKTFTRCILRSDDDLDQDDLLSQQIVTFLVEGYVEIMKVPEKLKLEVEEKTAKLRKEKIKNAWDNDTEAHVESPFVAYCEQVSVEEFEKQKMTSSQQALHTLLETIVQDRILSDKDKRRKLKQFQKNHPDIYSSRFPTSQSETQQKPRFKPPLLSKPLQRLKNLRL